MYLLFAFDNYYPGGGINDLVDSYSILSQAREELLKITGRDYAQIYSVETMKLLEEWTYYDDGWKKD